AFRLEPGPAVELDRARVVGGDFEQHLAQAQRGRPPQHEAQALAGDALTPAVLLADDDPEVGGAGPPVDAREVGEPDQAAIRAPLDGERHAGGVGAVGDRAQPALGLARAEGRVAPEGAAAQLVVTAPGDDARQVLAPERAQADLLAAHRARADRRR